jgi:hypothetical protein
MLAPARQSITEAEQAEFQNKGYQSGLGEVVEFAMNLPD